MAENLLKDFGKLMVHNRSLRKVEEICAKGAENAGNAERMAKECDVIIVSLPGPAEVSKVVGEELIPNGKQGQWILDTSTIDPGLSRKMHESAQNKGITYVDCPVSGGKAGAGAGTLTFMIGAKEEDMQPVMPYLSSMGNKIYYLNIPGGGSSIKIINNFMTFAAAIVDAEGIVMAEKMGISLEDFFNVVLNSGGMNGYLRSKEALIKAGNIEASFTVNLVLKDLELAADLSRSADIPNFTGNSAIQWFRLAKEHGYGDNDSSAIVNLFRELNF